jgi:hypothetical protein
LATAQKNQWKSGTYATGKYLPWGGSTTYNTITKGSTVYYFGSDLVVDYIISTSSYIYTVYQLDSGFEKGSFSYSSFNIDSCSSYSAPFSLASSVTYNVPDELFTNSTEYKINSTTLKVKSASVLKMSTSLNKYYIKETKNGKSSEMTYDGTTGATVIYMNGKCYTQTT